MTRTEPVLGERALNRALLSRQLLTERAPLSAVEAVGHLVGMQAQAVNPPYIGLWTRVAGFRLEEAESALLNKELVRMATLRSTIHLVTAQDALRLRPLLAMSLARVVKGQFGRQVVGVDLEELSVLAPQAVQEHPLTFADLGRRLNQRWPQHDPNALAQTARNLVPLVQVPPRGLWSNNSPATHTTLAQWLGRNPFTDPDAETDYVVSYLAAFGPATVKDIQKWSGLTGLKRAVTKLGERLRTYRDDTGAVLYDLAELDLPAPDVEVPVRLLPEFDNILLSHADRRRIMDEAHRPLVFTSNGIVRAAVLVDGFVQGRWSIDRSRSGVVLVVEPFRRLDRATRGQLENEGQALLALVAPDLPEHDVRIEQI